MAVYVSKQGGLGRLLAGRSTMPPPLFALTADSEDELHAFAARLGIRRDPGTPATPAGFIQDAEVRHYLLTEGERNRAVELGAQAISARKAAKIERQQAAVDGETQPRARNDIPSFTALITECLVTLDSASSTNDPAGGRFDC